MIAQDLLKKKFPPLHWNIKKILPAGTTLLFGKPKKGKSYLALMMGIKIAAGEPVFGFQTSRSPVLFLGLEDSERRLQSRIKACAKHLSIEHEAFTSRLSVHTMCPRIDGGLANYLTTWIEANNAAGLIVIGMLKNVVRLQGKSNDIYAENTIVGGVLSQLCHQYPTLSIVTTHHARKAESDDPVDLALGTNGLTGSYDNLAAIVNQDGRSVLHMTGRDIEQQEIPLITNKGGLYTLEKSNQPAELFNASETRTAVYKAIPHTNPTTPKEIAAGCKLDVDVIQQQLKKLIKNGLVIKVVYGKYQKTAKRYFQGGDTPSESSELSDNLHNSDDSDEPDGGRHPSLPPEEPPILRQEKPFSTIKKYDGE